MTDRPQHYCCDMMRQDFERKCDQHPDRAQCPDALMSYSQKTRQYGLYIHDGGDSSITIAFCPWCGADLKSPRTHNAR